MARPADGSDLSGAAIYVFVLVAAALAMARGMAFALSLGSSRRAFALGTGAVGVVLALVFGTLLLVLNRIEVATSGWGLHGRFFSFEWLDRHSPGAGWLLATVLLLLMYLIGAWISTIWLRWKTVGLFVGSLVAVLVGGGMVTLISWLDAWSSITSWLGDLTPLTTAGWAVLLCLPLAAASYVTLRRVAI